MAEIDPELKLMIAAAIGPAHHKMPAFDGGTLGADPARFPAALREVWETYGLITLAEGRLRLIDPARLAPLMAYIFADDIDLAGDVAAIAHGNMGEVVVWSANWGFGFLSPRLCTLEMPNLTQPIPEPPDLQVINQVLTIPASMLDATDPDGALVHDRLVARLGALPPAAIYASTPAPPPIEGARVEDFVVADISEWLEAVYTETSITLVDWTLQKADLRLIGQPWPPGTAPSAGFLR
jgi:hypothetical protein